MNDSDESGTPTLLIAAAVAGIVTFVLWGVACAMYDAGVNYQTAESAMAANGGHGPTRSDTRRAARTGVIHFAVNSVAHLPQLPQVLAYTVRERTWFAWLSAIILTGVAGFAWIMKRTEASLNAPVQYRNKVSRKKR